jgi:16S rRNA C967 or C1407 C5-methylase (RsmB/RsmF family)
MTNKATNLQLKLSRQLFDRPEIQTEFINALNHPPQFHPCIIWCQPRSGDRFDIIDPLPWQPSFVDRLSLNTKPGKDPRHDRGEYYCLDFSSVFAASVLQAIDRSINTIFDMCAAPGGKSIFAWQLFKPQFLIANETIGKRLGILIGNLRRCQITPSMVFSADPSRFEELTSTCDLVLVDAPCSGQSLLAKGMKVPGCFHPVTIDRNANRQKRILANAAQIVAPLGYLSYTTCTYAISENEGVCEWFLAKFPNFRAVEVPILTAYRSLLTELPGYRLFPHSQLGAGAFAMLFQRTDTAAPQPLPLDLSGLGGFRVSIV